MNTSPKVSLIIAVYKNIPFLELVLRSVERQTFSDLEVIVAEDNNGPEMRVFIDDQKKKYSFSLQLVSQPKNGFRKNRVLNEAVKISRGAFLQFIDGDCVLHPGYIAAFYSRAKSGYVLYGRRVELDEKTTQQLINGKDFSLLRPLTLMDTSSENKRQGWYMPWINLFKKERGGIWGCSLGMMKGDLMKLNGFDEDYDRIGVGEDTDLEWRIAAAGLKLKSMRYTAIQYHLHHPRTDRSEDFAHNMAILNRKKAAGHFFCKNGIQKS